jgi:hypothetical protein
LKVKLQKLKRLNNFKNSIFLNPPFNGGFFILPQLPFDRTGYLYLWMEKQEKKLFQNTRKVKVV